MHDAASKDRTDSMSLGCSHSVLTPCPWGTVLLTCWLHMPGVQGFPCQKSTPFSPGVTGGTRRLPSCQNQRPSELYMMFEVNSWTNSVTSSTKGFVCLFVCFNISLSKRKQRKNIRVIYYKKQPSSTPLPAGQCQFLILNSFCQAPGYIWNYLDSEKTT